MTVQIGLLLYNTAFFPWVISHLQFIGWPAVFVAIYKLLVFLFKAGRIGTVVEQRVLKAEDTIHKMATNHLPHIQMAIEESNKHLAEISTSLKLVLARRGEDA